MSIRSIVVPLSLPLLLLACSAPPSAEATGEQSSAIGSTEGLIKSQNGLCLDVYGDSHQSGAAVDLWTCNGSGAQTFIFDPSKMGPIVNKESGLCLDDVWAGGVALQMVTCNGTAEQQWSISGTARSAKMIDLPGHCVDIQGNQQVVGQTVDAATCNGSGAQLWSFVPLPPVCGLMGKSACYANGSYSCNPGGAPRADDLGTTTAIICCQPTQYDVGGICCAGGQTNVNGACVACGANGQPACAKGACNGGLSDQNGTCRPCGANGQVACSGGGCGSGLVDQGGTCRPCGGSGQPVCSGNKCNASNLAAVGGTCEPCGQGNEACCTTSGAPACASGLTCNGTTCVAPSNNGCSSKRGPGCMCASDGTCSTGSTCVNGTCYACGITGGICCPYDRYNTSQCSQSGAMCEYAPANGSYICGY
jgi:hypothetical protein